MSVIEIVFAILLILSCVFIIAIVLMQESKQGMSNVISGGSADNYFQKNSGRTKEAKLSRATKVAAVIVFLAAIAVNLISVYWGGEAKTGSNDSSIGVSGDTSALDAFNPDNIDINMNLNTDDGSASAEVTTAAADTAETTAAAAETTTAAQ